MMTSGLGIEFRGVCINGDLQLVTIRFFFVYTGWHVGRARTWCPANRCLSHCRRSASGRAYPSEPKVEGYDLRFGSACRAGMAGNSGPQSEASKLTMELGKWDV
jgi:hypothetical protein